MLVSFAKKFCESHSKRFPRLPLGLVRVGSSSDKPASHSVSVGLYDPIHLRTSGKASSTGAILSPVRKVPHVANHDSYYRRLDTDPAFAAEMSERQHRIGQWP
jgi:hypothetical protein